MTTAEKILRAKADIDAVYEAGKAQGGDNHYDTFWDIYQEKGKKLNYNFAFAGSSWNAEIFKPKYPLNGMTYANNMFAGAHGLIEIPYTIDLTNLAGIASSVFDGSTVLKTIKEVIVDEDNTFSFCFRNCNALEEIRFSGTIGQSGLSFQWCTKLSADSLLNIVEHLSDTATGMTITFPKTAEANYNSAPPENAPQTWAALLATKQNWSIAYA